MRTIRLDVVSREAMRPPYDQETQAGDWFFNTDGDLVIRVIGTDFDDHETFLFALHEMTEAMLCRARGISQEAVDAFDRRFADWPIVDQEAEPGDHPACNYRTQHRQAMLIEHLMANFLGLTDYGTIR